MIDVVHTDLVDDDASALAMPKTRSLMCPGSTKKYKVAKKETITTAVARMARIRNVMLLK